MNKSEIDRIVREAVESVLGGSAGRACVGSGEKPRVGAQQEALRGVCLVKGVETGLKQFDLVPGVNARLVDLVNSSNGCSMAVGLMELRECTFDWTLNYEEVDYVLDGTLDIVVGEHTYRAFKGDAIFIPKGTSIKFSTPTRALFIYATFPADWANQ